MFNLRRLRLDFPISCELLVRKSGNIWYCLLVSYLPGLTLYCPPGGSPEEKSTALMETHNLLKESESINEENSYDLLSAVMGITEEEDTELVSKALKVLDKFLVYQPDYMAPHCEEVITKIVRAKFSLQNAEVSPL